MPTINLDDLVNPTRLPRVILFGREIAVRPLTGAAAHRIASVSGPEQSGQEMLAALLEVVRGSCPELSSDEIAALTVDQITALVQLSRNQIAEVEQMIAEQTEKN